MPLKIGDLAPNFDLTSSVGPLLMLRDEVPRTAIALYIALDATDERARRDLAELARQVKRLAALRTRILVLSRTPLEQLVALGKELALPFPLLHDDRAFCAAYDVVPREDGTSTSPALLLVGSDQRIRWMANPVAALDQSLREIDTVLATQASSAVNYPRSVISGWIDRLVH